MGTFSALIARAGGGTAATGVTVNEITVGVSSTMIPGANMLTGCKFWVTTNMGTAATSGVSGLFGVTINTSIGGSVIEIAKSETIVGVTTVPVPVTGSTGAFTDVVGHNVPRPFNVVFEPRTVAAFADGFTASVFMAART